MHVARLFSRPRAAPRMTTFVRRLSVLTVLAGALAAPSIAKAEPYALPVDVGRVLESSYSWFEARTSQLASPSTTPPVRPVVLSDKPVESTAPFNPPVRLSLVARDWSQAYALSGRAGMTDGMRLNRSMRMLVGRARLDLGAVQPFVHVGLGEWRFDPTLQQVLPQNREYASQVAAGLEVHFSKDTRLAMEADYTLLLRSSREPQNLPTPRVLGAFFVMRSRF